MSAARDTALSLNELEIVRAGEAPSARAEPRRAAPTTVEALMYELRTDGVRALGRANCQRRLCDLSTIQAREVIERLTRLRARYPTITDELLLTLTDQL